IVPRNPTAPPIHLYTRAVSFHTHRAPATTLIPYTTLFRSWGQPQLRPEGPSAETTGVVEAPMAPGEVLSVSNIRGNLQVTGGAADRLQTRYTITAFAEDEAAAAQYAEALEVVAVRREEGLVLELIRPAETPPGVQSVAVDYQIAVPRGARIQVENRLGQVEVAGVAGPSWVENGYGE